LLAATSVVVVATGDGRVALTTCMLSSLLRNSPTMLISELNSFFKVLLLLLNNFEAAVDVDVDVVAVVLSGGGLKIRFFGKLDTRIDFFSWRALYSDTGSRFSSRSPICTRHRFSVMSRFRLEMSIMHVRVGLGRDNKIVFEI
jgi:hypothetical protein